MPIRDYLRILRRRLWIPIALVLATVLGTGAFTLLSKPASTATATVVAKSQNTGSTTPSLSFQEVATSNNLALRVIRELNLSESVDQVTSRIKVSSGRSNLYTISVTDADSEQATRLANAVAKDSAELYQQIGGGTPGSIVKYLEGDRQAFRDQYLAAVKARLDFIHQHPDAANSKDATVTAQYLQLQLDEQAASQAYLDFQGDVTKARVDASSNALNFEATVVDEAAAKPDTTSRFLKVGYAAALAFIVGIGIIFALEYLDNSVRDPEEVEELVGAPVVAIIPSASPRTLRPARGGA